MFGWADNGYAVWVLLSKDCSFCVSELFGTFSLVSNSLVAGAVEAQQKLEQVQVDLEEVSLRERQLKETSGLLANELDKQRSNESTSASEIVDMRGQLSAMQQALQNKEHTMEELRAELQKGSQVCPSARIFLLLQAYQIHVQQM